MALLSVPSTRKLKTINLFVTGTKERLCWLVPMEALDQIRVKDKCEDYELCHSAGAGVHQDICNEDECVQHQVDEPYGRRS
jgi:hypothetical protein